MKIVALYDIHGNLPALQAVLEEIENSHVALLVIGGDVIAGPMPNETLHLLRKTRLPMEFIIGNAESEVLRYIDGEQIRGLTPRADEEARWVANQLNAEDIKWIRTWNKTLSINTDTFGNILFCHATPHNNVEIFTQYSSKERLRSIFKPVSYTTVICGHTHMQFDLRIGNTQIINAGSVGMPFGKMGADWIVLDTQLNWKNTEYNVSLAAEQVKNSNYPYAERFIATTLYNPVSKEAALHRLHVMETKQSNSAL